MKYSDIIAKVRDIDLNEVAQKMSLAEKVISGHRHYILHDSEVITVSGKKFYNHYNKVGGGGAIDFVIHCLDCGFNQAVSWLVDKFDLDQATSAVRYYSKKIVKDAVKKKKPYYPPAPDPKLWPQTKKYLLTNRKLDPALVDQLHNQKFLYASEFKGHCNIVFTNKNGTLSEKRGLKSNFKGVEAGSRIDDGGVRITVGKSPKTLVLVESGIDAISYAQLYPDDNYIVMSTAGARPEGLYMQKALDAGYDVVCGYDNDISGNNAFTMMKKKYPDVKRHKPDGNDWNEDVIFFNKPIEAKAEHSEVAMNH